MRRPPAVTAREVIRVLEKAGFSFVRQKGSRRVYVKEKVSIIIPYHPGDLRKGTLLAIIKQAELTTEEFLNLL